MKIVVIDTNVLISGIGWVGAPRKIIDAWIDDKLTVVATPEIVEEYKRVSAIFSKKYAHLEFEHIVNKLLFTVKLFEPAKLTEGISCDLDDDKFIACALSAEAKVIISGDSDLLEISGYQGISVLKPKSFLDRFGDR